MGKSSGGWTLRWQGVYACVRFSHEGKRHELGIGHFSLPGGERDVESAKRAAAHKYAEVVSRKYRPKVGSSSPVSLDRAIAKWLVSMNSTYSTGYTRTLQIYGNTWLDVFDGSFAKIHEPGIADYARIRLRFALRCTVLKELGALRGFLSWCQERGWLEVPPFPSISRRAVGVRTGPQRAHPVDVTEDKVKVFLSKLPEMSSRSPRGKYDSKFHVRAYFEFLWETGLRPSTVDRLRSPDHYRHGDEVLRINDAVDKARFGRELPLSNRAAEILSNLSPDVGLIFGRHDYRVPFARAAKAASMPEGFSTYDLRHGRASNLLEKSGGNLLGVAYLLGHKHATTTDKYLKSGVRHAQSVLDSAGDRPGGKHASK